MSLLIVSSCSPSTAPLDMKFPNALYSGNVSDLYEVIGSASSVDLSWKDSNGIVRKLSGYHGKVAIVTFWQSSLGASDTEIASLDSAAREMPDSLRAIGIATDNVTFGIGSFRTVLNYVTTHPIKLQVIVDSTGLAQSEFPAQTRGTPQSFVLDTTGSVVAIWDGYFNRFEIDSSVRSIYGR
ncbi:MAG TPA: TlpA disulfide reductase family protein [Candidatus Kapabacteria bacterium]|nr:TlpA disulfide reductase family protein [Candidatus Kapabacteria bacterium]